MKISLMLQNLSRSSFSPSAISRIIERKNRKFMSEDVFVICCSWQLPTYSLKHCHTCLRIQLTSKASYNYFRWVDCCHARSCSVERGNAREHADSLWIRLYIDPRITAHYCALPRFTAHNSLINKRNNAKKKAEVILKLTITKLN